MFLRFLKLKKEKKIRQFLPRKAKTLYRSVARIRGTEFDRVILFYLHLYLLYHQFTSPFIRVTQLYALVLQPRTYPFFFSRLSFFFRYIFPCIPTFVCPPGVKPFRATSRLSKFTLSPSFRSKTMFPLFDHFSFSVRCTRLSQGFKHVVRARPRWKTVETTGDTHRKKYTDPRALSEEDTERIKKKKKNREKKKRRQRERNGEEGKVEVARSVYIWEEYFHSITVFNRGS